MDMDTLSIAPLPPRLRESAEFVIAKQDQWMASSERYRTVSALGEIKRRGYCDRRAAPEPKAARRGTLLCDHLRNRLAPAADRRPV